MKRILLALTFVLLLAGCQASQNSQSCYSPPIDDSNPRLRVILESDLIYHLAVVNKVVDDSKGLPRAAASIQNLENEQVVLEYQFVWKEASGFPINQANAWHRFKLTPHLTKDVISMAKQPGAHKVELTIRYIDSEGFEFTRDEYDDQPQ